MHKYAVTTRKKNTLTKQKNMGSDHRKANEIGFIDHECPHQWISEGATDGLKRSHFMAVALK